MNYFRWRWSDDRGDEYAGWGPSTWLWIDGGDGWSIEQWEVYDGGQVLHYDVDHEVDKYGMLADKPNSPEDLPEDVERLTADEYRAAIESLVPLNRPSAESQ